MTIVPSDETSMLAARISEALDLADRLTLDRVGISLSDALAHLTGHEDGLLPGDAGRR